MPQLKVGSDEHKQVFCREFVDTHHAYEPEDLRWPDLAPAEVERLRSLPFWGEAIGSERTAAARVRAMADVEPDPIMREAIAMQAYEELRASRYENAISGFLQALQADPSRTAVPDLGNVGCPDLRFGPTRVRHTEAALSMTCTRSSPSSPSRMSWRRPTAWSAASA